MSGQPKIRKINIVKDSLFNRQLTRALSQGVFIASLFTLRILVKLEVSQWASALRSQSLARWPEQSQVFPHLFLVLMMTCSAAMPVSKFMGWRKAGNLKGTRHFYKVHLTSRPSGLTFYENDWKGQGLREMEKVQAERNRWHVLTGAGTLKVATCMHDPSPESTKAEFCEGSCHTS